MKANAQSTIHYAKQEGKETHWPMIGRAFYEPKAERIVLKLDSIPMSQFWPDGRLVLYPTNTKPPKQEDA